MCFACFDSLAKILHHTLSTETDFRCSISIATTESCKRLYADISHRFVYGPLSSYPFLRLIESALSEKWPDHTGIPLSPV